MMLVGVTIDPREYENRVPTYPESRMCRVFGYPKRGLPTWRPATGDGRIDYLRRTVPGLVPHAVFQDWRDDAAAAALVGAWLEQIDGPVRLCWRHEADRKREDSTVYRHRYFLLAQWVANHPNGHHVTVVPTSTYQWTMSTVAGKGRGDWSRFHVGVGRAGIDVYGDAWRDGYPAPDSFLEPVWRYRDLIGADVEFPEFGMARLKSDPDGHGRADWLTQCASLMASNGVTAVAYWDDIGSNGTDLRLYTADPDTPEVAAWRAVMAGNNTPPTEVPSPDQGGDQASLPNHDGNDGDTPPS